MADKKYKNVYTVLEKVKKGEIKSHYKNSDGLFGKLNFYKKPDLIKPHMHYIDEYRLRNILESYLDDEPTVRSTYLKFSTSSEYKKIDSKPDFNDFYKKVKEKYKKFPSHMVRDVFKMFYNKMEDLEFEERTDDKYVQYKFLEKANNPVSKIMTEKSNLKSAIFARNIVGYYIMRSTMMEYVDPNTSEQIQNGLDGNSSDFDSDGLDKALKKLFDNNTSQNMMNDALDQATETCKKMDKVMSDEMQDQMFDESSFGNKAGQLDAEFFDEVLRNLERISLSMRTVKEKIKKLLDKSINYFSSKTEATYEDLFNSDNMAGLDEYELLHPKLRKMFMEDILVKDTKAVGKIDIYVDISGSMASGCGVKGPDGTNITKLEFAKAFITKLRDMDMLNDVYAFNTRVQKIKNDPLTIAMLDDDGGTTINKAVSNIVATNINALVITDAEDHCSIYSDKAFFIGVEGSDFTSFDPNVIKQYSDNDQVVVFTGDYIFKVNDQGYTHR